MFLQTPSLIRPLIPQIAVALGCRGCVGGCCDSGLGPTLTSPHVPGVGGNHRPAACYLGVLHLDLVHVAAQARRAAAVAVGFFKRATRLILGLVQLTRSCNDHKASQCHTFGTYPAATKLSRRLGIVKNLWKPSSRNAPGAMSIPSLVYCSYPC